MQTTLGDVARQAGVSLATASRVLSSSPRNVSPERRERVLEAAAQLNYVANANARALARAGSTMVGVLIHDIGDPYFTEIAQGILLASTKANRLALICNTYRSTQLELKYLTLLRAQRVEGLILAGGGLDDREYVRLVGEQIQAFVSAGGRIVYIGRHDFAGDLVLPDNIGGGRAVARLLHGLGHRQIGVIAGPRQLTTTTDRLQGFVNALRESGDDLPPDRIVYTDFSREQGAAAAFELLQRHPGLTALFALNDAMAIGALGALRQHGLSVPDDVSLVGFDDIQFAKDQAPPLTTVVVPMAEMGEKAMTLLLNPPETTDLRTVFIPTRVVERGSTAPVRPGTRRVDSR
jgi:LacI family transcriptional regulator